jgi:DNA-binding CsgD family transcriptional regulator/PAS domain-containing protein
VRVRWRRFQKEADCRRSENCAALILRRIEGGVAMTSSDLLTRARELLSDSSADPAAFDATIALLGERFGATSAVGFVPATDPQDGFGVATIGWNAPYTHDGQAFAAACGRFDPWREQMTATGLDLRRWVLLGDDILPQNQWGDSPWHDFFDQAGIADVLASHDPGLAAGDAPVILSFYRDRSKPRFDRSAQAVLQSLAPDVRNAAQIRLTAAGAGVGPGLLAQAFAAVPDPVWLVRPSGALVWCNAAADAMAARGDGIGIAQTRLAVRDTKSAERLAEAVAAAGRHRGVDLVVRTACDLRMPVRVAPVVHQGALLALVVARPPLSLEPPMEALARRYKLSSAERTILPALLEGHSARVIAATRRTSVETVRKQIRTIYAKLGVERRVQLAQKLQEEGRD